MSNLPSHPLFPESWREELPFPQKEQKNLYPIDETEEFHDPYSELSLFLTKKIKREMEEHGSTKKWTSKIQNDLLEKILPEFRIAFPSYRLGANALKKLWEKVAFYYGRVQEQQGAIKSDGKLDIELLIRENLRDEKYSTLPHSLPAFSHAQQLATKLCECIATLEGVRPNLDYLFKMIWSSQKHMIHGLSAVQSKSPSESYSPLDKLIVKSILELNTTAHPRSPKELVKGLIGIKHEYETISALRESGSLYTTAASITAKKLKEETTLFQLLTTDELEFIYQFIERQLTILEQYGNASLDTKVLEAIARMLALYPLATALPENIDLLSTKKTISYLYAVHAGYPPSSCPIVDQQVYMFILSEMHLYPNKSGFTVPEVVQEEIIDSLQIALSLPKLSHFDLNELEILIWDYVADRLDILSTVSENMISRISREIATVTIDTFRLQFSTIVKSSTQSLSQAAAIFRDDSLVKEFHQKAELWSYQGDLLARFVHFDTAHPIVELAIRDWDLLVKSIKSKGIRHTIRSLSEATIDRYPFFAPFRSFVEERTEIVLKYLWLNYFAKPNQSTYERYSEWVAFEEKHSNEPGSIEDRVRGRMLHSFPLIPYKTK